jgi:hypothetical protein
MHADVDGNKDPGHYRAEHRWLLVVVRVCLSLANRNDGPPRLTIEIEASIELEGLLMLSRCMCASH